MDGFPDKDAPFSLQLRSVYVWFVFYLRWRNHMQKGQSKFQTEGGTVSKKTKPNFNQKYKYKRLSQFPVSNKDQLQVKMT